MQEDVTRLERFIFRKMSETKMPGLSLAVLKNGKLNYRRSFGYRDVKNGKQATYDTLFGLGSLTKSMTALAVMMLYERKLLDIDDPVDNYIPLTLHPMGEKIRVRHLMSHTSGIPALAYAEAILPHIKSSENWLPISNYHDVLLFINGASSWVHSRPGEKWFYLNEGYILLGGIIEKVSGNTYTDFIKENILRPLKMSRSFFSQENAEKDSNFAVPYMTTNDGDKIPSTYYYSDLTSDGGLISCASDMVNYLEMFLGGGAFRGKKIVATETIKEMTKPHAVAPDRLLNGENLQYGYGLVVNPSFLGSTLISHSGSVYVSTAYMGMVPSSGVGVIVLANSSGYPLNSIGDYALATFMGRSAVDVNAIRRENIYDDLSGVYESYMGILHFTVKRSEGLLWIEFRDRHQILSLPIFPRDIEGDVKHFDMVSIDRTVPVEFIEENGVKYLEYERFKLKKIIQE
jgi:CubicO group peptidase (beta-lactamase class C family)